MSDQICKVCKMAAVPRCPNTLEQPGGASIMRYEGDDVVSDVCPNMKIVALRQRLFKIDPQFAKVKHDSATPLFQRGQCDRTQDNLLFTQTDWMTFLSHFKWVIGNKEAKFFVRVVTDTTLKQVYMGEASLRSRLPDQREEGALPVFNSLEDLLAMPDLVIIKVGFVIYFNRAMASILHEALLLRVGIGKPTWIIEQAGQQFKPYSKDNYGVPTGMPCCNEDVAQFVETHFESIQLEEAEPATEEHEGEVTARGVPDPELPELTDEEEEPTQEAESERATGDESEGNGDDEEFIESQTKRKPPRYRRGH